MNIDFNIEKGSVLHCYKDGFYNNFKKDGMFCKKGKTYVVEGVFLDYNKEEFLYDYTHLFISTESNSYHKFTFNKYGEWFILKKTLLIEKK